MHEHQIIDELKRIRYSANALPIEKVEVLIDRLIARIEKDRDDEAEEMEKAWALTPEQIKERDAFVAKIMEGKI